MLWMHKSPFPNPQLWRLWRTLFKSVTFQFESNIYSFHVQILQSFPCSCANLLCSCSKNLASLSNSPCSRTNLLCSCSKLFVCTDCAFVKLFCTSDRVHLLALRQLLCAHKSPAHKFLRSLSQIFVKWPYPPTNRRQGITNALYLWKYRFQDSWAVSTPKLTVCQETGCSIKLSVL